MEREELEAMLQDENVQAMLAEKYVSKADFDKVNNKKEQILGEKKKVQEKTQKLEEDLGRWEQASEQLGQLGFSLDEILPQVIESLQKPPTEGQEDKEKDLESRKLAEDRMAIQKQTYEAKIESLKREGDKKMKELQDLNAQLIKGWNAEKIENTLNAEMDRIGVSPSHKKLIKASHRGLAEVSEDEDGVRSVLINDGGMRVSATEFFDAFAQSDEGKAYIMAPTTTGGGALGGKGGRANFDYAAARQEAMKTGDVKKSIALTMSQYRNKK